MSRLYEPEPAAASFRLAAAARAFVRAGVETTVLTSKYLEEPAKSIRDGVSVKRWPVLRDANGYVRGYLQYLSFDIPLFFRLLGLPRGTVVLAEPPPTTGMVTLVASRLKGLRYAYYAADLWSEAVAETSAPSIVRRALRWMEVTAARGAAVTLSVSEDVARRLGEWGVRSAIVGNGIDTEVFRPLNSVADAEASGPLLVYTGTASEVHGAGIFVEAMRKIVARFPEARLVFMGQGEDIPALREAAGTLPSGAVRFLPRQAPAAVTQWLNRADIALASVKPGQYSFAFPTKVYAAAACGTPVVFAGEGQPAEEITVAGIGVAVPYSPEAVTDAVFTMLEDVTWDGGAAREWIETYASLRRVGERVFSAVAAAMSQLPRERRHR